MVTLICLLRVLGMAYTTLPFGVKSVWSEFSSVQPIILIRSLCVASTVLLRNVSLQKKLPGEKGHGVNTASQWSVSFYKILKAKPVMETN